MLHDHFRAPSARAFEPSERERVTILVGGLTARHDRLVAAVLQSSGYLAAAIPVPTKADFHTGREFGNKGQCNPTYFTVGALINYLKRLRDVEGVATETILADYVFVTAGSCGPCRFGMYEAEFRLALRNAGFGGFRVVTFNQSGRLAPADHGGGLALTPTFFGVLVNAIMLGDLLNEIAAHIRPYEIISGATDRALDKCLALCVAAVQAGTDRRARAGLATRAVARLLHLDNGEEFAGVLAEWRGRQYVEVLRGCRELIDQEVEVDYTRPKPIAKITGEFWAQTTEGDGNFRMFSFLEQEGAQVLVEPVTTWIDYSIHYTGLALRDRSGLGSGEALPGLGERFMLGLRLRGRLMFTAALRWLVATAYERRRRALGSTAHRLVPQPELQRLGHPYYNSRCGGGEGHLEVAKNIYYGNRDFAHFVLSLKPFGCLPSTQSDGAQAAVLAHHPSMIFLPVETSGEGDIDAYSRVQMVLGTAKAKARQEFDTAVARSGYPLADICAFVAAQPVLRRPLRPLARTPGVVGQGAKFILEMGRLMDRDKKWAQRKCPEGKCHERHVEYLAGR